MIDDLEDPLGKVKKGEGEIQSKIQLIFYKNWREGE
jgi:hypothetical protein